MTTKPPLPDALWSRIPEEVRAALAVALQFYQTRIEQLEARVAELEARLKSDSSNSHKPPSSDLPHAKPAPPQEGPGQEAGRATRTPRGRARAADPRPRRRS